MSFKCLFKLMFAGLVALMLTACGGGDSAPPPPTPDIVLNAISVTADTGDLPRGRSRQYTASGTYSDGSVADITSQVTWSSSEQSVASVGSNTGNVIALSEGAGVRIYASMGSVSGFARLNVIAAVVDEISVTSLANELPKGRWQQYTATGIFSDGSIADITSQSIWTSLAPSVAHVEAATGRVTAVGEGGSAIQASFGSISGSANLSVMPAVLDSVAIHLPYPIIGRNIPVQLTATGTYSDLSEANISHDVTWASSNPSIVSVQSQSGVTTGVSAGTAEISASLESASASSNIEVISSGWTAASSMGIERSKHSAVILPNGNVLVTGGIQGGAFSFEIFDPKTNTWSQSASTSRQPISPTVSSVSDGRIIFAGGEVPISSTSNRPTNIMRVYDTNSDSWLPDTIYLRAARYRHSVVSLPDGRIFFSGGQNENARTISSAEIFDPTTNLHGLVNDMSMIRDSHASALLPNNKILVIGGSRSYTNVGLAPAETAELYNFTTQLWELAPNPITPRRMGHTASVLSDGKVVVVGGNTTDSLAAVEIYDSTSNTWRSARSMPNQRHGHTAIVLISGKILVSGGSDGTNLLTSYLYDPASDTWADAGNTPYLHGTDHASTILGNGAVLMTGGLNGGTKAVSLYWP